MKIGDYIFQWMKIPKIERKGVITQEQIKEALDLKDVFISDEFFDIVSTYDIQRTIMLDRFKEHGYETRIRDCDDFAAVLNGHVKSLIPGIAFGIIWVDILNSNKELLYKHAINFFFDEDGELKYVEPQDGKIFSPSNLIAPFFAVM